MDDILGSSDEDEHDGRTLKKIPPWHKPPDIKPAYSRSFRRRGDLSVPKSNMHQALLLARKQSALPQKQNQMLQTCNRNLQILERQKTEFIARQKCKQKHLVASGIRHVQIFPKLLSAVHNSVPSVVRKRAVVTAPPRPPAFNSLTAKEYTWSQRCTWRPSTSFPTDDRFVRLTNSLNPVGKHADIWLQLSTSGPAVSQKYGHPLCDRVQFLKLVDRCHITDLTHLESHSDDESLKDSLDT